MKVALPQKLLTLPSLFFFQIRWGSCLVNVLLIMALTLLEVIKLKGKKTFIFCAEEDSRGASDFANAMRLKCSLFLALCQNRDRQSAVMHSIFMALPPEYLIKLRGKIFS